MMLCCVFSTHLWRLMFNDAVLCFQYGVSGGGCLMMLCCVFSTG